MHLGIALPFGDIGGDGPIVREFAQLAEAEGYDGLTLADHVLGGNPANPASGRAGGLGLFHDPFVAFGFIAACTKKVELSTQVLILAQRQTVLVAKQAASLDVLSGGRFRFGIGVGWNELEFVGLNENFHNRGKRSEEQVQVMKALWADPYVTFEGKWHRLPDAGINPRPPSRKIPLWFGGHMDVTLQRIAKWGDGWMMLSEPPGPKAVAEFRSRLRWPRSLDLNRHRHRKGLARGNQLLEEGRRYACHAAQHLRRIPPQTHGRPEHDRSCRRHAPLPQRRRRSALRA
jgi:probable F420-dependent oxidoreductase